MAKQQQYKNVFNQWQTVDTTNEKPTKVRKSPSQPAKAYNVGDKMKGADGTMYIVRNVTKKNGTRYKKWFKIAASPKRSPKRSPAVKRSPVVKKSPAKMH